MRSIQENDLLETFKWTRCFPQDDWRCCIIDGHGSLLHFAASMGRIEHIEWFRHMGLTEEFTLEKNLFLGESVAGVANRCGHGNLVGELINDFEARIKRTSGTVAGKLAVSSSSSSSSSIPSSLYPCPFEGFVNKSGPNVKKKDSFKNRYFILDENNLSYFKSHQDSKPIKSIDSKDIIGFRILEEDDESQPAKFFFEICTRSRNFLCWVDQESVRSYWQRAIAWIQKRLYWRDFFKTNFALHNSKNCYISHAQVFFSNESEFQVIVF